LERGRRRPKRRWRPLSKLIWCEIS
jgi:hypothetical protein